MDSTIVIVGSNFNIDDLDHVSLSNVDTLGFDADYRQWNSIGWYPTHYCCLKPSLIEEHCHEIKALVDGGQVQAACLTKRFLDFFPETAQDSRYVFPDDSRYADSSKIESPPSYRHIIFAGMQLDPAIAEYDAIRYAIYLGYTRIGLVGFGSKSLVNTVGAGAGFADNGIGPNASAGSNAVGDAEASNHNAPSSLRLAALAAITGDLIKHQLDVELVNCSVSSELYGKGLLPFGHLDSFVGRQTLDTLAILTQTRERDQILNNLRLWQTPEFVPFLHLRGREKLKLVFTFTGETDETLTSEILEEYNASILLQRWFHSPEFHFFLLPPGEDVYIKVGSPNVGKKGYKSGPNQQFFRSIFALADTCRCAYFMETDCLPIRPDWLGQLCDITQSSEPFWVMGSHYRGKLPLASRLARHINGSAIYAVGNADFIQFAREWNRILDEVVEHQDPAMAYDCVLEHFFEQEFNRDDKRKVLIPDSKGWQLFQEAASYLRYSESILNYSGKPDLDSADDNLLRYLRRRYKNAYVVHNRTLCDQAYTRVLGFDREQDPVKGSIFGCFPRSQHAHIDESRVIAELWQSHASKPVVAHIGSASEDGVTLFAAQGWQVHCFESDLETYDLGKPDLLSLDAGALNLAVLNGISWHEVDPEVVQCRFGPTASASEFDDLVQFLTAQHCAVIVSEWHPTDSDSSGPDWYRLATYPCQLAHPEAWGQVLGFKRPPDLTDVGAVAKRLVDVAPVLPPPPPAAPENREGSVQEPSGMAIAESPASPDRSDLATPPPNSAQEVVTNRFVYLLSRLFGYYTRWPVGIAVAIVICTGLSTVETMPFRSTFTVIETLLTLFLVGHAATRSDRIIASTQSQTDRALESAAQAQARATTAIKKGDRALERFAAVQERANEATMRSQGAEAQSRDANSAATEAFQASHRLLDRANRLDQSFAAVARESHTALTQADQAKNKAEQAIAAARQSTEAAERATETASQATERASQTVVVAQHAMQSLAQSNAANAALFQPLGRQLSAEHIEAMLNVWGPTLNVDITSRALGYLAHQICLTEDACSGRLAAPIEDMVLRALVARSVQHSTLSVLEIGALFGVSIGTLHNVCRGYFDAVQLTAIDPLDTQPGSALDGITQVPVTAQTFEHNMRRLDIPFRDVTLLPGLSHDEAVLRKAGQHQYNLLIIDGDRSYAGVKFDFEHYLPAVDVGGYVVFDDYGTAQWPDVTRFVDKEVKPNQSLTFVGASWKTAVFRVAYRSLV